MSEFWLHFKYLSASSVNANRLPDPLCHTTDHRGNDMCLSCVGTQEYILKLFLNLHLCLYINIRLIIKLIKWVIAFWFLNCAWDICHNLFRLPTHPRIWKRTLNFNKKPNKKSDGNWSHLSSLFNDIYNLGPITKYTGVITIISAYTQFQFPNSL